MVAVFVGASALCFPFFDKIVHVITAPLQGHQQLVYLTPGGAFSFMMTVCVYVGLIVTIPVLVYHIYRFVLPAVGRVRLRTGLMYLGLSFLMAVLGVMFTYVFILPAALHFLTSFNLAGINPMLTVDSYLSFVMTYIVAGALLFQLPIIISIIDSVRPLTPGGMMRGERVLILVSFIAAGVLSPTPDALNQTLLAAPVIIVYQASVVWIWWKHRRRQRAIASKRRVAQHSERAQSKPAIPADRAPANRPAQHTSHATVVVPSIDGMKKPRPRSQGITVPLRGDQLSINAPARPVELVQRRRSIDGVFG